MIELSHSKLNFLTVQSNTISNLLKAWNANKAAGIGDVSGRILKDGADVLDILITQISNVPIKIFHFPNNCKPAKLTLLYKKVPRVILKLLHQSHFQNYWESNTRPNYGMSNGY